MFATSDAELLFILDLVAKYTEKWHIEFSGAKSIVIPIHRKPNINKEWSLGRIFDKDMTPKKILISEGDQIKYLGMICSRTTDPFLYQRQKVTKSFWKTSWRINQMAESTDNPAHYGTHIWKIYGIPAVEQNC